MTQIEQIRFTRNHVATNFQWAGGDETVTRDVAKWRRSKDKPWIPAKKIYAFPVRGGTKVIYCFDEEHSRGEGVQLTAWTKSDHPRVMRILWPTEAPPKHVEIRHGSQPARSLTPRRKEGRAYIEEKIPGMAIGEVVKIDWTW